MGGLERFRASVGWIVLGLAALFLAGVVLDRTALVAANVLVARFS
jgi:hypothetical protein